MGYCEPGSEGRLATHIAACGLPADFNALALQTGGKRPTAASMLKHMAQDKKVVDGKMTLILLRSLGQAFIASKIPAEAVQRFLREQAGLQDE
jgi:3-dehydroquinate synthetase